MVLYVEKASPDPALFRAKVVKLGRNPYNYAQLNHNP